MPTDEQRERLVTATAASIGSRQEYFGAVAAATEAVAAYARACAEQRALLRDEHFPDDEQAAIFREACERVGIAGDEAERAIGEAYDLLAGKTPKRDVPFLNW